MTLTQTSRRWLAPLCLVLLLAGLTLPAPAVHAATTWHVTSCLDNGGAATLRGRINGSGDGDTIVFDQDCTIVLGGALTLSHGLTIDGLGHTVVVDGNNNDRVFAETGFAGLQWTLSNLTIQHGHP